jgi:hypothetical protein
MDAPPYGNQNIKVHNTPLTPNTKMYFWSYFEAPGGLEVDHQDHLSEDQIDRIRNEKSSW